MAASPAAPPPGRLVPALIAATAVVLGVAFIVALLQRPAPTTVLVVQIGQAAVTDDRWHTIEETAAEVGADLVEVVVPVDAADPPDAQWLQAVVGTPAVVVRAADRPGHSANLRIVDEQGGQIQGGAAESAGAMTLLIGVLGVGFLLAAGATVLTWRGLLPAGGAGATRTPAARPGDAT